jgi:hypothetical protein
MPGRDRGLGGGGVCSMDLEYHEWDVLYESCSAAAETKTFVRCPDLCGVLIYAAAGGIAVRAVWLGMAVDRIWNCRGTRSIHSNQNGVWVVCTEDIRLTDPYLVEVKAAIILRFIIYNTYSLRWSTQTSFDMFINHISTHMIAEAKTLVGR